MPYTITLTNGSAGPVIADYTQDNSTSLTLLGRGSSNYGVGYAQSFVHLLENFANVTAPNAPLKGQLWYNTQAQALQYYDAEWHAIATLDELNAAISALNTAVNAEIASAITGFITGNQNITLSGDISGSGTTAITTTLPNVNTNPGTWNNFVVNAKGLITAARSLTASDVTGTLGYTPVQQGGGVDQGSSKIYIGWAPDGSGLKATVDATDEGYILTSGIANDYGFRGGFGTFQFLGYDENGNNPAQTFTVPAGVSVIKIICTGGGGGGCGSYNQGNGLYISAGGGGAGGTAIMSAVVTPGQVLTLTVGPGGSIAGVFPSGVPDQGHPGGTSIVNGYIYATGGSGAGWPGAASGAGGGGGYGILADNVITIQGGDGGDGMNGTTVGPGGVGGASFWGGGGRGGANNGIGGTAFGSGGGGSYNNIGQGGNGGAGAAGLITFEW